jgi:hypothetical protein
MSALGQNVHATKPASTRSKAAPALTASPTWLAVARETISRLRHGAVLLVIHDGRVTQIERTEKTRLNGVSDGNP